MQVHVAIITLLNEESNSKKLKQCFREHDSSHSVSSICVRRDMLLLTPQMSKCSMENRVLMLVQHTRQSPLRNTA